MDRLRLRCPINPWKIQAPPVIYDQEQGATRLQERFIIETLAALADELLQGLQKAIKEIVLNRAHRFVEQIALEIR